MVEQTERDALAAGGVVLRYGFFSGPGTWYAHDSAIAALVRKRRYPIVGEGAGVHSFVHVDDAAAATVAALARALRDLQRRRRPPRAHLDVAARLRLRAGRQAAAPDPAPVLTLAGAGALAEWQESLEGADNARAKAVFDWTPVHATWRTGFRDP